MSRGRASKAVRSQAEPGNEFPIALFRRPPSRYKHPVGIFLFGTGEAVMADKSRPSDSLFWPATLLLISVAVSLICWGIYNMLPQTARAGETPLRITQFPPKFNHTSKEVSAVKKPEVQPEPRRVTVAFASAEPPLFTLPMEEAPPCRGCPRRRYCRRAPSGFSASDADDSRAAAALGSAAGYENACLP